MPGDLDKVFFTLGGAEANENAIRIAKAMTGRQKILARYRSYHGATYATITLTGDPRRWANEPGHAGRRPRPRPLPRDAAGDRRRADRARVPRGDDHARGPRDDRRVHPGARHRHERDPDPARRLPPGRPRALRPARDPADRRRGDVRVRPHRRVVRGEPLGRRAGHHHDGEGPDLLRRAARRGRAAPKRLPSTSTTTSTRAASPTTRTRSASRRRSRRSACTRRTA